MSTLDAGFARVATTGKRQGMLDAPSIPACTLDNDRHKMQISNRKKGGINGKRGGKYIANKLQ